MQNYKKEFDRLNPAQKKAVELIEGPVLTIAGPGTGKTQLLALRVGHILQNTDYGPECILCITFTDNAAEELRKRLYNLLGAEGNKINVFTFHSFGSYIIGCYPEYFDFQKRNLQQLDEIGQFSVFEKLLSDLPYRHPLAGMDENGQFTSLNAVKAGIKAIKQSALSASELRKIASSNIKTISRIEPIITKCFDVPRLSMKALDAIEEMAISLINNTEPDIIPGYPSLDKILGNDLLQAINQARLDNKTGSVGQWRTKNLRKKNQKFVLYARTKISEFDSLIDLFETYQKILQLGGLYDFEDMILWVLEAFKKSEDLRLDIAEQFLYIMIDEFQDTNRAQGQLISQISGVDYGITQPNVFAVGDDDQAIMSFQGANMSNMIDFVRQYNLTNDRVITLIENYRSQSIILQASRKVITQTQDRLELSLQDFNISKQLIPKAPSTKPTLERLEFSSRPEEFTWISQTIKEAINSGVKASEICVIAPKHEMLIGIVPYLLENKLAIAYERKENILEQPIIRQILKLAELLKALADNKLTIVESLLPEILSYPFWNISPTDRINIALSAQAKKHTWLQEIVNSSGPTNQIIEFLLKIKDFSYTAPFEQILDMIIGSKPVANTKLSISPLKDYYFSRQKEVESESTFMQLLSNLGVLRDTLRNHFSKDRYYLADFLDVMQLYSRSNLRLIDNNPLTNDPSAVQLTTAYGAKGQEFSYVFIISAIEDSWGPNTRGNNNQAYIPNNLPIYPAGSTISDKVRLLYVAMTRAKNHLYITSYSSNEKGKATKALSLLDFPDDGWWISNTIKSQTQEHNTRLDLPQSPSTQSRQTSATNHFSSVDVSPHKTDFAQDESDREQSNIFKSNIIKNDWHRAYDLPTASLKQLLAKKLSIYQLSPTHLKNFLDITRGGPENFKTVNLLRFPEAKNFSSSFGSAIHKAMEQAHLYFQANNKLPDIKTVMTYFESSISAEQLLDNDLQKAKSHAQQILPIFYEQESKTFKNSDIIERKLSINYENIKLSGKLDKIEYITPDQIRVIDYKTGKPPKPNWQTTGLSMPKKVGLYFNRQQLLFYKILAEKSVIAGKKLIPKEAQLRYAEPHQDTGELVILTIEHFDDVELNNFIKLITAVWNHIQDLNFPDTSKYPKNLQGIKDFESDLINNLI